MHRSKDTKLSRPRPLTEHERRLIDSMLQEPFPGRDELRTQLADVCVVALGPHDTRTIVFGPPAISARACVASRVPVDAVMADEDGMHIEILLHVVDGVAQELESYRVDGKPIQRTLLDGPLKLVNWKPAAGTEEPS